MKTNLELFLLIYLIVFRNKIVTKEKTFDPKKCINNNFLTLNLSFVKLLLVKFPEK